MPAPKTIAFVSDAIYPYNKGGKETRLYEISTRLAKRGYDVHIYCMKWWDGPAYRIENGVHLHGISPYIPLYDGSRRSIKQGLLFGLACLKLVTAKFDVIDVDHMPFFPIYSVRLVCWLRRKKMHATWHEVWGEKYWDEYLGGVKAKIATTIEKFATRLPDQIVSISPLTAQRLMTDFYIPAEKITTVPCGYNDDLIKAATVSPLKSDIIFVGRLLNHKNVDVLLKAVAKLKTDSPQVVCRIIGTGPEEINLKQLSESLQLEKNVFFHGRLENHGDIFSMMKASKVFVLPSTREGFGIVVLEANACGLPVVTVDHPDNAATLFAQEKVKLNSTSLSEVLTDYIFSSKERIASLKKVNLSYYSWEKITGLIAQTFFVKS